MPREQRSAQAAQHDGSSLAFALRVLRDAGYSDAANVLAREAGSASPSRPAPPAAKQQQTERPVDLSAYVPLILFARACVSAQRGAD